MIDTEVGRLRRLRNSALRARAVASALDSNPELPDSVFSRGAVSCWQIARVITGKLRAHPYRSYQRGPSGVRAVYDRYSAGVLSHIARARGRKLEILSAELQHVAHELDDARALNWSADFGDAMGRSQKQIGRLVKDLGAGETPTGAVRDGVERADHWPYLAF